MAVNESQRLDYLREMGVQAYFPRRPLPGAKPSRAYAQAVLQQTSPHEVQEQETTVPSAQDVLSMLGAKPSPVSKVPTNAPELAVAPESRPASAPTQPVRSDPPVETPQTSPAPLPNTVAANVKSAPVGESVNEEVRFAFAYFPINEQLAVINELPWNKSASVTPSCRKLLADILKALGLEVPERNLNPMVFTWPMFEGTQLDSSRESARQALEGFVTKRLRLRSVQTLLVLAEQSAQYLFPAGFLEEQGAVFQHPKHEVQVIHTHSLNAMEAVPELKRPVWAVLQPLRLQLKGSTRNSQDGISENGS